MCHDTWHVRRPYFLGKTASRPQLRKYYDANMDDADGCKPQTRAASNQTARRHWQKMMAVDMHHEYLSEESAEHFGK
jgi:hypothetical protein